VQNVIKKSSNFVDRGDPAAYDMLVGDFTTDATWRDIDLSAIVPKGAKAVLLRVKLNDDVAGSHLYLRQNGKVQIINAALIQQQVPNQTIDNDLIVPLDADAVIEYSGANLAFIAINLIVRGWWI